MNPRSFYIVLAIGIAACAFTWSCTNPFAPKLLEGDILEDLLGNPSTLEGFYTRFQNAYQLRDTTLYGPLIHPEFIFTYRDPEQNVDISWGRSQEMNTTSRLFQNSRDIQLQWSNIITRIDNPDRTRTQVIRRFNLTVLLEGAEMFRTDGAANFILTRTDSTSNWQLLTWRDESDI